MISAMRIIFASKLGHPNNSTFWNLSIFKIFLLIKKNTHEIITRIAKNSKKAHMIIDQVGW